MFETLLSMFSAATKFGSISQIAGHLHVILQTISQECAGDAVKVSAGIQSVINQLQSELDLLSPVVPVAPVIPVQAVVNDASNPTV